MYSQNLFSKVYSGDASVKFFIDCVLSGFFVLVMSPLLQYGGRISGFGEKSGLFVGFILVLFGIMYFGRMRV